MVKLRPLDLFALVALFERGTWTVHVFDLPLVKPCKVPTMRQINKR